MTQCAIFKENESLRKLPVIIPVLKGKCCIIFSGKETTGKFYENRINPTVIQKNPVRNLSVDTGASKTV
jgi:hypothetical protein